MSNHNRECASYNPGHRVHWIQARLSRAEEPEPVEVHLFERRGFQVDVVMDGQAETWRFHDTSITRQQLDSWVRGESARLRPHGLLGLSSGACLYPCRDPLHWHDCIARSENAVSRG